MLHHFQTPENVISFSFFFFFLFFFFFFLAKPNDTFSMNPMTVLLLDAGKD